MNELKNEKPNMPGFDTLDAKSQAAKKISEIIDSKASVFFDVFMKDDPVHEGARWCSKWARQA